MKNSIKKFGQYRTDVDGLRAIAVLSVILFHINHDLLPGGFVGVDVFFVISGYLISLHIFNEMDTGVFSLKEFYRRRIKRIMPAMFLVVGVTLIFSQIIMLPKDSTEVANTSIFSLLSIANVYFWKFSNSSYFAPSSDQVPLLHLWSLGVEEQFYIFWPIVILLLYKRINRQIFISVLICTILLSTLIGELLYSRSHSFIYYMLPSRAGEFLIGAFVAYLHKDSTNNLLISPASNVNKVFCSIGLSLIVLSFFIIDKRSIFPGLITVVPTIGTGLILFGGQSALGGGI